MHIVLDFRPALRQSTGVGTYVALATRGLRLYLAFRFAIKRLFARGGQQRKLAADLLRCTLRESDR